jgi:hypothetical protein
MREAQFYSFSFAGSKRDKAGSGQRIFAKKKGAEKFGPLKIRLTRR